MFGCRKINITLYFIALILCNYVFAQTTLLNETFSNSDALKNWNGDTDRFMINKDGVLQSIKEDVSNTTYISKPLSDCSNFSLTLVFTLTFNPSTSNRLDFCILSEGQDLKNTKGKIYLRIGESGNKDRLIFYDGDSKISESEPIDWINSSLISGRLCVEANESNQISVTLYSANIPEKRIRFSSGYTSNYSTCHTGFLLKYTKTRSDKFFFDNLQVITKEAPPDMSPPKIQSLSAAPNSLTIAFDEEIEITDSVSIIPHMSPSNSILPSGLNITMNVVGLHFNQPLEVGTYSVVIKKINDKKGNIAQNVQSTFEISYKAKPGDIILNEMMVDPNPVRSLPDEEYIELYNTSNYTICLSGYEIMVKDRSAVFPDYCLVPQNYVVLVDEKSAPLFYSITNKILTLTTLPTLLNSGATVTLYDQHKDVMDSLYYSIDFYHDETKDDGGYSLERIHFHSNTCGVPYQWHVSFDERGGTPGERNSVIQELAEEENTVDLKIVSDTSIELNFRFPVQKYDPNDAVINIRGGGGIEISEEFFTDRIVLTVQPEIPRGILMTISINNILTCYQNSTLSVDLPFKVGTPPDISPPKIQSLSTAPNSLTIAFDEEIEITDSVSIIPHMSPSNSILPSGLNITMNVVGLHFNQPLEVGTYSVVIKKINDKKGNIAQNVQSTFEISYKAKPGDIILNEMMVDPNPVRSLPDEEYIELYNTSNYTICLSGYEIMVKDRSAVFPDYCLVPQNYVVLADEKSAPLFYSITNKILTLTTLPILLNSGATVTLYDQHKDVMDSLYYSTDFYHDETKDDGGYSMERIHFHSNTCGVPYQWHVSFDEGGGTPGERNSVIQELVEEENTVDLKIVSDTSIELNFRFPVQKDDPNDAVINIKGGGSIEVNEELFTDRIVLTVQPEIPRGILTTISINNILSCYQNTTLSVDLPFKLKRKMRQHELLISEILYEPDTGVSEYIEIYCHSDLSWNMEYLEIVITDEFGEVLHTKQPFSSLYTLSPHQYLCITEDKPSVSEAYPYSNYDQIFETDNFPNLPNSRNKIFLYYEGVEIDEIEYHSSQHSFFIKETKGVALEVVNLDKTIHESSKLVSASSLKGFGTPGYPNSQTSLKSGLFYFELKEGIFSPDGDGFQDELYLHFGMSEPSLISIEIFDVDGNYYGKWIDNMSLDAQGTLSWDSTTDSYQNLVPKIYILYINLIYDGREQKLFKVCILAKK